MYKLLFLLLFSTLAFSQSVTLVDKINNAIDVFVANPNKGSLTKLNSFEKSISTVINTSKNKNELLAFVILKCNKAFYENQFGQTQNAIKSYENAWRIFDENKLSNYDIVESCLIPLSKLYITTGDYTNAENSIKHYLFLASNEKNISTIYNAVLSLSIVYQNTGRIQEAISLLEKSIQTENLNNSQKGNLYNNLGNNYLLNNSDFEKAKNCYLKSIALLKNNKTQTTQLSNVYRNLSKIYSNKMQFDLANDAMEKSRDLFFDKATNEPREQAKLYIDFAQLNIEQKQFDDAKINIASVFKVLLPNYKIGLPSKNSLYAENTLLDALDLQSEIYLAENQPKKALESYALSFYIEELFQSFLVYENSKIIIQLRNRNRTEKCIAIYYDLYIKEKNISYLESAFKLAEKTKSVVLKEEVSSKNVISREEKIIKEQLQNWNTIIIKEQQKLDYANISKINHAIKKQNELMLLLKSKELNKFKKSKEINISKLFSKLENDKANLIEFFYGENNCYIFKLENNKIKLETIPNINVVKPKITRFLDFFKDSDAITNNLNNYVNSANEVYNLLKIPQKSATKNLIIIPDGILNLIPFEALISKKSTTTNFSKMNYFLKDYVISYSNSAQFYTEQASFKFEKESVLGVFPVFKNSNLELTYSINELKAIEKQFNGNYFQKSDATFLNFKQNALNYSILHLSTHASSGDIFEPATIKFIDKDVIYSEFYNLNIHPNLVVLSACETGLGKLFKSEGAMSVARGFQFAGAQNLLFSLWKVNDFTTSVFMANFYNKIKNGSSYSQANHDAKLDFLNDSSIPNAKKSPYYWSAFVYYGSLEERKTSFNFVYIFILFAISIVGFLMYYKLKK